MTLLLENSREVSMLMSILIAVIVLVVVFWLIKEMTLPHPIGMLVRVVVGIIGIIYLLGLLSISLP